MLANELGTPRRQATLGVVIIFLLNLKKWGQVLVFGLLPFLREKNQNLEFWMFWVFAAVVLLLVGVFSYLQWKNFFFYIEDDKFVIKQGVFRKEESLIPLERIQTVHIKRNIVQQILNLAALQLDTAGSAKEEAQIPALKYTYAAQLKGLLLALKENGFAASEVLEAAQKQTESTGNVLMQLSLVDLLKVGLTENHLRSALILAGIFFGYISQYSEFLGYDENSVFETAYKFVLVILPIFIVAFSLISVFWSMWRTFMRYFNLTVELKQSGLSVHAGLLKKEENFVPVNKIQYIKWQSNPLRKLIGYQSLAIYQAASAEVNRKKTVKVPGCKADQRQAVNSAFYPEYNPEVAFAQVKPDGLWQRRLLLFSLLPALVLLLLSVFFKRMEPLILLPFYVGFAVFFIRKYVAHFQALLSDDLLVVHRGYVFPEQVLLKLYKVQNVEIVQSIFQKRKGLLSLKIYTASGSLSLPFIAEKEGFAIANKLLFEVEKSSKNWM